VWAQWLDPSINEGHAGRFDPVDIEAFVTSAEELMDRDRPSPKTLDPWERSDPIEDIDQGMMYMARHLDGEFWARDMTVHLVRAEGAHPMEFSFSHKDAREFLETLQKIAEKTKWEEDYRDGMLHGNPAVLRTLPEPDPDNAYIDYPVVLLDAGLGRSDGAMQGDTWIRYIVDEEGNVNKKSIRVVMSDHRSFSREVTGKVEDWKFRPLVRDGVAISVQVFERIPFRLRRVN
jgi:hypothetical protein